MNFYDIRNYLNYYDIRDYLNYYDIRDYLNYYDIRDYLNYYDIRHYLNYYDIRDYLNYYDIRHYLNYYDIRDYLNYYDIRDYLNYCYVDIYSCRENNQELIRHDIIKLDEGSYKCEATNEYGSIESPKIFIFVIGKYILAALLLYEYYVVFVMLIVFF